MRDEFRVFDRYEFDWDDGNVEHIARHGVEPWEAEEAVADVRRAAFSARGENRAGVIGMTENGRMLVVIVDRVERPEGTVRRVATARDTTEGEKKIYRRRNR